MTAPSDSLSLFANAQVTGHALTKAEHAYQAIRELILRGELEPGATIEQESVAASLGLSTTPLREALRRLESEQLVVFRAHRDTIVAPVSIEALHEVYTVRVNTEPLGAALASTAATPGELRELEALINAAQTADEPVNQIRRNQIVHRAIYRASHNDTLIHILDSLNDVFDRYRVLVFRQGVSNAEVSQKQHTQILDAIRRGDADLATSLMRNHIEIGYVQMRNAQASLQSQSAGKGVLANLAESAGPSSSIDS
jgi:DNA-binding GntR family transcriptional regulator